MLTSFHTASCKPRRTSSGATDAPPKEKTWSVCDSQWRPALHYQRLRSMFPFARPYLTIITQSSEAIAKELATEQAEVERLRRSLSTTEDALRCARAKENRLEADLEAITAKLRVGAPSRRECSTRARAGRVIKR